MVAARRFSLSTVGLVILAEREPEMKGGSEYRAVPVFRDAVLLAASLQPLYALLYPIHTVVEAVQAVVHILPKLLTALPTLLPTVRTVIATSAAGSLEVTPSTRPTSPVHADILL
jgi:hypothetical protein